MLMSFEFQDLHEYDWGAHEEKESKHFSMIYHYIGYKVMIV